MTIRRHLRSAILALFAASLVVVQLNAGTTPEHSTPVVVGAHHAAASQVAVRRQNTKRLVSTLPVSAGYHLDLRPMGEVAALASRAVPIPPAGVQSARAPPVS